MEYGFGSGSMWATTTASATATPARFGALQEASLDFSATVKELFGTFQLPLAVARGTVKVTGKGKYAQIQNRMFNDIFFGATVAAGSINTAVDEPGTIPTTPFAVTVINSATWTVDLGVKYTSGTAAQTGTSLVRVASAPATGQYTVAAGVYTFAAADTGLGVTICYNYTTAAVGNTSTMTNQILGVTPVFATVLSQVFTNKQITWSMPQCTSSKLMFPTKLEDFVYLELDFSCYCNAANVLGTISLTEVS